MAGGYEPGGDAPVVQDAVGPVVPGAVGQDGVAPGAPDVVAPVAPDAVAPSAADPGGEFDPETIELIAQIRQLAAEDPHGVQQIISEVLAALDRVTGTTPREP
jgi:hypothetical protein